MSRLLRTVSLSLVLAVAVSVGAAAPASASGTTTARGRAAAGWLASRFVSGTHLRSCFGTQCFPDYGLTADAVIGMASTHSAGAAVGRAESWLAAHAGAYIGTAKTGGPFPGSYAKLALTAEVTGRNPAAFGGVDLLARLRAQQCPHVGCTTGQAGEFRNRLADGGFPNVITQSLAIVALSRSARAADRAAVPAAVGFLRRQQCGPASGFPTFFPAGAACTPEVDATAFAVQALLAARAGLGGAAGWLAGQQRPSGGFAANGTVNANSTGLAIEALAAAGRPTARAHRFLMTLQLGCSARPADRGAISFDGVATFKPATAVRATTQGILGLTRVPLAAVSSAGSIRAALRLACP